MSVCTCVPGVPCEVHPAMSTPDAKPTTRAEPVDAEEREGIVRLLDASVPTNKLEEAYVRYLRRLIAQVEALEAERERLQTGLRLALPVLKDAPMAKAALGPEHPAFQGVNDLRGRVDIVRKALRYEP